MSKLKIFLNLGFVFVLCFFLSGCATLSYVGDDYDQKNLQTVKTQEELVFDVYKKTTDNCNFKIGISKTPVTEIMVLYVQVENLSYETHYTFKVDDLRMYNSSKEMQFITSSNYLNIWQTQEASSMSALGSMGATLSNMSGMSANYNDINQSVLQNSAQESSKSAFSNLEAIGNGISKHSIKYSATISPRRSQYFYFFFEDLDDYPIKVKYKDIEYQFKN